jgi:hypothetical protein
MHTDEMEKVRAVKQAHEAALLAKANVVGLGIGYQRRNGVQTDNLALVVLVSKKVPRAQLSPEDVVPGHLDGVPVDVQEIGRVQAQG